nr:hypothetical protein [Tanacetum cinerariifolium]
FSRCSWCGGPFNGGNCRHCTNVSSGDEPVYDSNPNSYNQTPDFSNPPPHHNYEIDSRSDTTTAFQAEFTKFQQNFKQFMAQLRCLNYGGLFNGGNCPSCSIVDDDDDYGYKESILPLNEINSQIPPSIVITTSPLVLPIEDPEDSLIIRNEELNTIPEKESDEFINLVLRTLFKSQVSPRIHPGVIDIECKYSYDPNLDESTFLVTPISDSNKDEYFTPGDDVELLLHHDSSIPKMSVASILAGFTDEPPLEENDNLFDLEYKNDDWKKILYDAPIDDLITEDKVFDPEIHDQNFSPAYVSLPFTNRHYIFFTYVIRILLLYFTYPAVSPFSSLLRE